MSHHAVVRRTVLAFVLLAAPVSGQPVGPVLESGLRAYLDSLHAAGSFPGATLGVAFADGWSLALAVGTADTARRTPMPADARMLAGSVGKTFFAAAALDLVREGRLDLDAPISRWLGEEPWFDRLPNARDISVRMLMNHTSGLVRYEFDPAFLQAVTADPYRVWRPAEQLEFLFDEPAPFPAGQGWTYSDTNYIVLAMIIERITGDTAYRVIRARFLDPLQLSGTFPSDQPSLPGLVQGYAGPDNPFGGADAMLVDGRLAFDPRFEWGGGGYVSTSRDLARWALALWDGSVTPDTLLTQVFDGVDAQGLGPETRYGLGVVIRAGPLGVSYGHSGFFPGYMTEMRYWPDHGFALALQVNTSAGRPFPRSSAIVLQEIADRVATALAVPR